MTIDETREVLEFLAAFYGPPKSGYGDSSEAWHILLRDYDYQVAMMAAVELARSDVRDDATFPAPGKVIEQIEEQENITRQIYDLAYQKKPLLYKYRRFISDDAYKKLEDVALPELSSEEKADVLEEIRKGQIEHIMPDWLTRL